MLAGMRMSRLLAPPLDVASSAEGDLLERAGYTRCLADGLHSLLPLGHRVLRRISAIVREEFERTGAQEVAMPLLQPAAVWQTAVGPSTRERAFGSELFRLQDRGGGALVLAATHEEVATLLAAACVRDERDLPRAIFQIQPRFRDQPCSGAGLLRSREFIMADGYSFHAERASLDDAYEATRAGFAAAAARCGLQVVLVQGDSGAMGGEVSEELVAPLPGYEATVAWRCAACGYAADSELAQTARRCLPTRGPRPVEEVEAPDGLPVEALAAHLGVASASCLTWAPFLAGRQLLLAVLPGDQRLNPVKLRRALARRGLDPTELRPAGARDLADLGVPYDWISLVRTPTSVLVVADDAVRADVDFVVPSLRVGRHLRGVRAGRDFRVDLRADLALAVGPAACARCGAELEPVRGVEVAHVFKLGTAYAAAFGAQRADGRPLEMGCYGMGVTRLMTAVVEQHRDREGIVWPAAIAPFQATIVPATRRSAALRTATAVYSEFCAAGLEVLLDDGEGAVGEKLARSRLRGMPYAVVCGRHCDRRVDVVSRASAEPRTCSVAQAKAILRTPAR